MKTLAMVILGLAFSVAAQAREVAHCAYTNEGFGGDEGYEISIQVNDKGVFTAELSVIDPGGENKYSRLTVRPTQTGEGSGFAGKDFAVNFYSYLPETGEGFIFSYYEMPDDFGGVQKGGTLCKGEAVR